MLKIENLSIKNGLLTITLYVLLLIVSFLLEKVSPSGPCIPGLGGAILLGLPFITGFLLIINLIKLFRGNETVKFSLLIHFLLLLFLLIYIKSL
jgi:hypothetical protein